MPTISEMLQDYEQDMLLMIAEQWGIEDDITLKQNLKRQLSSLLNNQALFGEIYQSLPTDTQSALNLILSSGGKMPAAQFMRLFGEIREMGAGTREKERPDRNPISVSEFLFYRGLTAVSFFKEKNGAEEFIFIPQEFAEFLKPIQTHSLIASPPPPYSEKPLKSIHGASDKILDHIVSLLAAVRGNMPADDLSHVVPQPIQLFLNAFFASQKILDQEAGISDINKLKVYLLETRDAAFSKTCFSWMSDASINELKLLPNLIFEGEWKNDPLKTRQNLLEIVTSLPPENWYSISDFIGWMQKQHPDFQRTRGEYDLWFIKDKDADTFINGFENWMLVEGKLLEYFFRGPLFWMGIIDLGGENTSGQPVAFKKSKWAKNLLNRQPIQNISKESSEFVLQSNGRLILAANIQREIRYQIARFCEWVENDAHNYQYQLSPTALKRAKTQNISIDQIKTFFEKFAKKPIPKNIITAIDRWKYNPSQIEVKKHLLIHVSQAQVLDNIQKSPAKTYVVERLNPTTAIISSDNLYRLQDTLLKMGYFTDILQVV